MGDNILNIKEKPSPTYRGSDPYIFVSYASEDLNDVLPDIKRLQDLGYNVFYDENLVQDDVAVPEILQHIDDCTLFIVFVSDNSVASEKIKDELRYAISEKKPMLAILFNDFKEIEMSSLWTYELLNIQKINRNNLHDDDVFRSQMDDVFQTALENSKEEPEEISFYKSDEPYICVSYDDEDHMEVFAEIRRLHHLGCNILFDDDVVLPDKKLKINLKQIDGCKLLVVFISGKSATSENVKREIEHANLNNKPILPIYLEDVDDIGLGLSSGIVKTDYDDGEYNSVLSRCLQNLGIIPKDPTNSKLVPGVGREPLSAYRGENPYCFVSYAHKDFYRVFPNIKRFQDYDYNVWYDEGIAPASEWLENILEHLDACALFVVFVTRNSMESVNVRKEIGYARHTNKPILPIFLDDFGDVRQSDEWKSLLKSLLSNRQGIMKTTMSDEEYIYKVLEAFKIYGFEQYIENIFEKVEIKNPEEILLDDALKNQVLYSDIDSKSISKYVDGFFDDLTLYSDLRGQHFYKEILKSSIDVFLENKNYFNALDVYNIFFSIYQIASDDLLNNENIILSLTDVSSKFFGSDNLKEKQRDLFTHSVNVFILGLAIYSQNRNYRDIFEEYVTQSPYKKYYMINNNFSNEEFLFRWGITSMMHDIAYPFEKNGKRINKLAYDDFNLILGKDREINEFNDLNEIYKSDPFFANEYIEMYPQTKFLDLYKPTDLIAHKISIDFPEIELSQIKSNLNDLINFINDVEFEEHALLSSLLILNVYGYQIQEHGKDSSMFFYPIVDVATAIFLHNYYKYFLQNKPFNLKQLLPEQNPLAYLLILCDNILEFYKNPETVTDNGVNVIEDISFEEDKFEASYNVKSSSYGFGFSNELYLEDILELYTTFGDTGLNVHMDLDKVYFSNKIFISSDHLLNISMENIERISIGMIDQWNRQLMESYKQGLKNDESSNELLKNKIKSLMGFEELSSLLKMAVIKRAKSIYQKLNSIGCEIADVSDERFAITEFSDEEIDDLARLEHESWCEERIGHGWIYGKEKDDEQHITPYLIEWELLERDVKKFDEDSVRDIPNLIEFLGLKIVLSKHTLLTYKIYHFCEGNGNIDDKLLFDSLPRYLKKLNYKKTDLILESLSKLDYTIVDESHIAKPIDNLEKNEVLYLAQDNHDEWCKLNYSLGWRYGEKYDLSLKTNPNLVAWSHEKMDYDYAKLQTDIFRHLPELCSEIGLKIIKNNYNG